MRAILVRLIIWQFCGYKKIRTSDHNNLFSL